jgi:hypothetical protein
VHDRPTVIRVSPRPIEARQLSELRRIYGGDIRLVEVSPLDKTPEMLRGELRGHRPSAVVLDGPKPDQGQAIRASGEFRVLQRITEPVRTPRGTEQRWVGYGLVNEHGEIDRLDDGALRQNDSDA